MTVGATDRIRARLAEKRAEYQDFQRHHEVRTKEEDLHGMWDCCVCMTEVSNYIDGLRFALAALGEPE